MRKYLFLLVVFCASLLVKAQKAPLVLSEAEYQMYKQQGKIKPNINYQVTYPASHTTTVENATNRNSNNGHTEVMSGVCEPLPPFTYSNVPGLIEIDDAPDPIGANEVNLPFNFCFYGTNYNTCFINGNGNITFGAAFNGFTASGFPVNTTEMIAPFWADFDNRNGNGVVRMFMSPTNDYMVVTWDSIGYYSQQGDKRNKCTLIITDGISTILPGGNNVGFFYRDMDWTTGGASGGTNGFGGTAATVGVNRGDGVNFIQIGRFDTAGVQFIGNNATNNGVDWLDYKSFFFNICTTDNNIAPISTNFGLCDTIKMCGQLDTLILSNVFASPEVDQITTVTATSPTLGANLTVLSSTPGPSGEIEFQIIASPGLIGFHTISITGTDNGVPAKSTTIDLTIEINNNGMPSTILSASSTGICPGNDLTLTLDNCNNFISHIWSTGSGDCSITTNQPGDYYITNIATNGCYKTTFTTANFLPEPLPIVMGSLAYCADQNGTDLSLAPPTATEPTYFNILWSNGTIGNTATSVTEGSYTVTVTGSNGCVNDTTFSVVNNGPSPFTVRNDTCMTSSTPLQLDAIFGCESTASCAISTGTACSASGSIVQVGTSTTTTFPNPTPFTCTWEDGKGQYLFRASELQALGINQGLISSLALNIPSVNSSDNYANLSIKLKCTTTNSLSVGPFEGGTTTVFNSALYVPVNGWNTFVFTSPYVYDGISNLLVEICYDNTDWSSDDDVQYSVTTFASSVTMDADDQVGCSFATSETSYNSRPNMRFNYSPTVNTAGYTYNWTNNGVSVSTIKNPIVIPGPDLNTYVVTVTNGSCSKTDTVKVTIAQPVNVVSTDSIFCDSDPVQIFSLSPTSPTGGTWAHHVNGTGNGGGIVPATSTTINFHPELSVLGSSHVVYSFGTANCLMKDSILVTVSQKVDADFTSFGPFCEYNIPITLSAYANNAGGTWTINNIVATQFDPPTLGPSVAPGYAVKYKTDLGVGCPDSVTKFVEVFDAPVISFIADTLSGCLPSVPVGFTSTVSTPAGFNSYNWTFGDASTTSLPNPVHVYTQDGIFTVSLTYTDINGCIATETKTDYITVNTIPEPEFTFEPSNPTSLEPHVEFINLTPDNAGLTYMWNIAGLDSADYFNVSYDFPEDGVFDINLTATSAYGCIGDVTHRVIVSPDFAFYIPNSFSPNGDGLNDVFLPKSTNVSIEDYTMAVYDRWGERIFLSHDINEGWNGSLSNNGNISKEQNVFIYKIIYKDANLKQRAVTGQLNIVK